jgi:acetolactate synthase I/II/III large subunit
MIQTITKETYQMKYMATDLLIESLLEEKVEVIFTSPSQILSPIQSSIQKYDTLKSVFMNHEQAIVHATDGYSRATGKVGVAIISGGSGITNAITGIATAEMDSVPQVIIVCNETTSKIDFDDSRVVDTFGMALPIIKYYFRIHDVKDIQSVISKAFSRASEGRPGPVVIELQTKILCLEAPAFDHHLKEQLIQMTEMKFSEKILEQVKNEISLAKKPVLFIGGGVNISGAAKSAIELAEKAQIPVVSSLMGIGVFPSSHSLYLGMLGMHGTFAANKAVHHSDLLICLGVRFSDRVTGKISGFSPKSRKIQVDIDPVEINKILKVDLPIVGNVKDFLKQVNPTIIPGDTEEWVKEVSTWQKKVPGYSDSKSELKPQQVIELIDQYSNSHSLVATDVGQHQIWTSHYYQFKHSRSFITSGGLGTMGYGLPAAIGAALANKGTDVICVSGDGSFQMNFQELVTVARYQLPIKIAILKNNYLGMVRQWQELFYKGRYSSVNISSPDFVTLAEAYGIRALRATNFRDAESVIKEAFKDHMPIVMEFDITEEENVFPIVPPGANNTEAVLK